MVECRYCGRYFVNVGICLFRHEEERSCLSCPDATWCKMNPKKRVATNG
jgi:hypothetical protein